MKDFLKDPRIQSIREQYRLKQVEYSKQQEKHDSCALAGLNNKTNEKLEIVKKEYEDIKLEYARMIFSYFSEQKPSILVRKTKEIISWDEAFPSDFNLLSEDQVRSIIPLVEEDGGRYRLA